MSSAGMAGTLQHTMAEAAASASSSASATSSVPQTAPAQSPLGLLGRLLFGLVTTLPTMLLWIIGFATITLPTWAFTFLSTSLTLTVNMTTVLLILVFVVSSISWIVRYRFMNMYSRLPPEPQRKEPQVEVFPDTQESYTKPGLANYLDEFLSAIKVFGYLERPVFHELTRTMQTRKLIAGETLLLEEEKGFCLVVDGLVQIFVKSTRGSGEDSDAESPDGEDPGEERRNSGNQGYQLLTEVKNGAPMSSLFSILSLFTEDVKLRHDEGEESETEGDFSSADMGRPLSPLGRNGYQTPGSGAASPFGMTSLSRPASSRRISDINGESFDMTQGSVPPLSLDGRENTASEHTAQGHGRAGTRKRSRKHVSAHPDIVARASVDTTIAIIPATAFHRLTRVYPKATAHIVQVILTRLQRVTLATGHSYLGLTGEVLQTERLMDKYTQYDLPDFLRGSAMERLKDKFRKVRIAESSCPGIYLRCNRNKNVSVRKIA